MKIQENISLAPFTTFKVGGPAKFFCSVSNLEELKKAIAWARENKTPIFILGGGSNILLSDIGFNGLVIKTEIKGIKKLDKNDSVLAMAGENWHNFVEFAVKNNLQGIECLAGIPGTVGAAPIQNINAYGQYVDNVIKKVNVINLKTGEIKSLSKDQCKFGYRTSIFKEEAKGKYAVVSVVFNLKKDGQPELKYHNLSRFFLGRAPTLKEVYEAVIKIRSEKGMVILPNYESYKSVGSFFMNPVVGISVWQAILPFVQKLQKNCPECCSDPWYWEEKNGKLKISAACLLQLSGFAPGFKNGNAGISPKHALSIINLNSASAEEIKNFARKIQEKVFEKCGINLEIEPEIV